MNFASLNRFYMNVFKSIAQNSGFLSPGSLVQFDSSLIFLFAMHPRKMHQNTLCGRFRLARKLRSMNQCNNSFKDQLRGNILIVTWEHWERRYVKCISFPH